MTPELKTRFDLNGRIAQTNRANFNAAGITAISLVGPAGSGKNLAGRGAAGAVESQNPPRLC